MTDTSTGQMPGETEAHFDVIRFVYSVAGWLTLCLGLPLNATLIWLIRTKSPPAMRVYARLLLFTCVMDILLVLVTGTVQPILIADHGYRVMVQNGLFRNLPEPFTLILDSVWLQLLVCFQIAITFQFVFRYLLLSRESSKIPPKLVWTLIGMAVASNVFHYMVMIAADWPWPEHEPLIAKMTILVAKETGITNLRIANFSVGHSIAWYVHIAFMFVLFFSSYGTIWACVVKTRRHIRLYAQKYLSDGKEIDPKIMEINNQITQALILQAILPTFELFTFSLKMFLPILFDGETWFYIVYTAVPLYFIPVLSPLGTIIVVKPYRRAVVRALKGFTGTERGTTIASTINRVAPTS